MPGQGPDRLGLRNVPETNLVVLGSRDNLKAVRRRRKAQDLPLVAFEATDLLAGRGVPEADALVRSRSRDDGSVEKELGAVYGSGMPFQLQKDIRRRLAGGETRAQILDAYVAQHGKRVLAQPPAEGIARVLYVVPPVALVLTAALVVVVVRRFTASRTAQAPVACSPPVPVAERYGAALDEELRDLD